MIKTKSKKKPILYSVLWSNDVTGDLEEVYLLTSVAGGISRAMAYVPPYIEQGGSQGSIIFVEIGGRINKKTDFWITSDFGYIDLIKPNTLESIMNNLKMVKKTFGKFI